MKRFRRWLLNGIAAFALLLSVCTIPIWIGTYSSPWYKNVEWARKGLNGGIIVEGAWLWHLESYRGGLDILPDASFYEWQISYWKVVLLWVLIAAISVLPRYRQFFVGKRAMTGLCRKCGYDLRATPDRCPECGTVPAKKEIVAT